MEAKVEDAISFLMKSATPGGTSLFDHLVDVLGRVLERRTDNSLDTFEALSFEMRSTSVRKQTEPPQQQMPLSTEQIDLVKRRLELLKKERDERDENNAEEDPIDLTLSDEAIMFEAAGIGIGTKEEIAFLVLTIRELASKYGLKHTRLWGKLIGRNDDYIVLETDSVQVGNEEPQQPQQPPKETKAKPEAADDDDDDEEEIAKKKANEEAKQKKIADDAAMAMASDVPAEDDGIGSNKYSYWVCHKAGEQWAKLPNVTPAQINATRKIRKMLTGDLNAELAVLPRFPGKEINYLRAMIARITAATLVSPKGFYGAPESEDDGGDEFDKPEQLEVIEQDEWTGLQQAALLDSRNWVHHTPALLSQGRCSFWRAPKVVSAPAESGTDEDQEETATEEESADTAQEPAELPPPLLSSVSDDAPLTNDSAMIAWMTKVVRGVPGKTGCTVISSNRWPGAHAVACGTKFSNIYIGNGLKYSVATWIPALPKMPVKEFITETAATTKEQQQTGIEEKDPTVEQEKELAEKERLEAEARLKAEQEQSELQKKEAAEKAGAAQDQGKQEKAKQKLGGDGKEEFDDEGLDEEEEDEKDETTTEGDTTTS